MVKRDICLGAMEVYEDDPKVRRDERLTEINRFSSGVNQTWVVFCYGRKRAVSLTRTISTSAR